MIRLVRKTPAKAKPKRRPASRAWAVEEAKSRFGELIRRACASGPQRITIHGKEAAVLLSAEDFATLTVHTKYPTLCSLLENSPLSEFDFEFEPIRVAVHPVDL
jgi:prevent-host-death family protein